MNEPEPEVDEPSTKALAIVFVRFLRYLARWCEKKWIIGK